MRTLLTVTCASALFLAGNTVFAQKADSNNSKEVNQEKTAETNNGTAKTKSDIYYGKVESYDPGKTLKVSVPGKIVNTKSFDLNDRDETVNVASNVKVGDWVRVEQKKDTNGHTTLTVKETTKHPKNG